MSVARMAHAGFGRNLACWVGRGRDGACQTPSYWSTRNRSFGTRHPAFTKGSVLRVLNAIGLAKLPAALYFCRCPIGRLSIDRFAGTPVRGQVTNAQPGVLRKQRQLRSIRRLPLFQSQLQGQPHIVLRQRGGRRLRVHQIVQLGFLHLLAEAFRVGETVHQRC